MVVLNDKLNKAAMRGFRICMILAFIILIGIARAAVVDLIDAEREELIGAEHETLIGTDHETLTGEMELTETGSATHETLIGTEHETLIGAEHETLTGEMELTETGSGSTLGTLIGQLVRPAESVYASSYITKKGFPKSYKKLLKKLHKKHPSWKFTPVATNIKWSDAVKRMTANPGVNTLWYAYNDSYKSVAEGYYDYLTDTYSGGKFPAASEKAVKYFMDPRNFLDERHIYMFEDRKYHSYQKESMVKKLLSMNSTLKKNAKYYVQGGKKYNISPLYLASKSYSELGTSGYMMDGHKFTYKGIKYKNCYNAYNIGATDTLGKTNS